jgi:serine/threonine protein kinase
MAGRAPGAPPDLPGYTYQRLLGSGGFADVFLYEREMPRMLVAVKVLLDAGLSEDARRRFTDEANTMARLSTHPYIVPILTADIAQDGRPYLVMRYYSRENLYARCTREPLSVIEALRVGIQTASALETAHRAGIVHRDVKPANILTGDFGALGLTDFGIAATTTGTESADEFLSIPWSPPEAFEQGGAVDARSDIYSLGATVYSLLTGRSPFEVPGGSNTANELMDRITRARLSPTGRDDVPASFERVLARSMAKQPELRQPSALDFARDLQGIEQELRLNLTQIVVPDEAQTAGPEDRADDDDDGSSPGATRHKRIVTVTPAQPPRAPEGARRADPTRTSLRRPGPPGRADPTRTASRAPAAPEHPGRTTPRPPSPTAGGAAAGAAARAPDGGGEQPESRRPKSRGSDTRLRAREPAPPPAQPDGEEDRPARSRKPVLVGGALVLVAGAVIGTVLALGSSAPAARGGGTTTTTTNPFVQTLIPQPTHVTAQRKGTEVTVSWTDPAPEHGDYFLVQETPGGPQVVHATRLVVTVATSTVPCFTVELVRSNAQASDPTASVCATGKAG